MRIAIIISIIVVVIFSILQYIKNQNILKQRITEKIKEVHKEYTQALILKDKEKENFLFAVWFNWLKHNKKHKNTIKKIVKSYPGGEGWQKRAYEDMRDAIDVYIGK